MAFDELKNRLHNAQQLGKDYLDNSLNYYKLWAFKVSTQSISLLIKGVLLLAFAGLCFLFLSFAAAYALGQWLDSTALGFLCVALFYFILFLLLMLVPERWYQKPLLRRFSEIFFGDE